MGDVIKFPGKQEEVVDEETVKEVEKIVKQVTKYINNILGNDKLTDEEKKLKIFMLWTISEKVLIEKEWIEYE